MKKIVNALKPFDIEFQPFIEEINNKEEVVRRCADIATMERIRSMISIVVTIVHNLIQKHTGIVGILEDIISELKPLTKLNGWSHFIIPHVMCKYEILMRLYNTDISTTTANTLKVTQQIYNYKILELLTPLEPLKRHQDVRLPRTKNTGTWLLSLESFCRWRDSNAIADNSRIFCCYGIPGAGKTVMWYEFNL